jgi:hypothetical protein
MNLKKYKEKIENSIYAASDWSFKIDEEVLKEVLQEEIHIQKTKKNKKENLCRIHIMRKTCRDFRYNKKSCIKCQNYAKFETDND